MPIDTSMYQQNPMNSFASSFGQMMQYKNMADMAKIRNIEAQKAQNELNDQQAIKDAIKSNVTTGPDGTPTVDQPATLATLYKTSPTAAMSYQSQLAQQAKANQQLQEEKAQLFAKHLGLFSQVAPSMKDQQTYENGLKLLHNSGVDVSDAPSQFDPEWVNAHSQMALTLQDQMNQKNKARDFNLRQQEVGAKIEGNKIQRQQMFDSKQNQSLGQTIQLLESARGNPAAAQAEKDIYASQKITKLLDQYPNGNDMPPQMVKLLVSEVGKVAQGGSPTVDELQGLTPSTVTGKLAEASQKLMNQPTGANAGAFLKQYSQYAGGVAEDAKQLLKDKYGRVIEANRGRLSKDQVDTLQKQYIGRFDQEKQQSVADHPQDDQALQWAKQNPNDPRSAQILQLNGAGK